MILATVATCQLALASLIGQVPMGITGNQPPAARGEVEVSQKRQRDPFAGADRFLKYSFEKNEEIDFISDFPVDWTRRRGPGFPNYVKINIDRHFGRFPSGETKGRSLSIKVNGGQAIAYSPRVPIDPYHSYIFEGHIRTQSLEHDAALISVSFLNHKRQRIQRFLTRPVTGTHKNWIQVRISNMVPQKDVRFVVIGCHLVTGKKMGIHGRVWFDDLSVGRLPQMSLASNFHKHFVERKAPIEIWSLVTGLDPDQKYQLHLQLLDSYHEVVSEEVRDLKPEAKTSVASRENARDTQEPEIWRLPSHEYGFYEVRSTLLRNGEIILEKETSFAVMDLAGEVHETGEFGWSIAQGATSLSIPSERLASVVTEAGINWLKHPVWQSVHSNDPRIPARTAELFDLMTQNHIKPVGLLSDPPPELRNKFARDWSGISEIFAMQPSFWSPSLEPVIARYSSTVRYWQLGSDSDSSFVGMASLPETLANVKREFDKIGRDTRVGLHWEWDKAMPSRSRFPQTFLSLADDSSMQSAELVQKLEQSKQSGLQRWVVLTPLAASEHSSEERGADLVRRMVSAKIGGADVIFAHDVFDHDRGLLNSDGSPTLLFLPWRTTAMALQGAEYLGSFDLPGGSTNHVFARKDEVVVIIWNEKPTTEQIYLGEDVRATDVFGRQNIVPIDEATKRQVIEVGPTPLVIRGCSAPVARWRLATRFQKGRLASQHGEQEEAILGRNPFEYGVTGVVRINVPNEWELDRKEWPLNLGAGEEFKLPTLIALPPNVSLGDVQASIDFEITADLPYKIRVYRKFQVGLDDVVIQVVERITRDGRLEIEQTIINNTSPVEILEFDCSLNIHGHKRQKLRVTKLGRGSDKKRYYVPNAKALMGKEIWLRAEQVDGQRNLNYRWRVGENHKPLEDTSSALPERPSKGPKRPPEGRSTYVLPRRAYRVLSNAGTRLPRRRVGQRRAARRR